MRTGWNINTILEFKKINKCNECFDLIITYCSAHNSDSKMQIHIPSINNKDLSNIIEEIYRIMGE